MNDRPAILGGEPVTRKVFGPYNTIGDEEKREVMEVLDSGVLSAYYACAGPEFFGGPKVQKLERAWAERFGVKHAVAMNSATSALCAAVAAARIGPGDEVISSPLTMTATTTAVLANQAIPVFADVDPRSLNLDPASVARCITERTRAVFVAHLAGYPTDMDPILQLARQHDLLVLEDNAQAPGATYKGRNVGCIGDVGVFSLNCHKTIQTGEGGVAVTDNDDLALRLRLVRNHGEKVQEAFGVGGADKLLGFNFRMTEMEAAVAIHQLAKLDGLNAYRVRLAEYLSSHIERHFDFLEPPPVEPGSTHVYYIYHMRYDERKAGLPLDLFVEAVQAEGVPLLGRWGQPLYRMSIFRERSALGDTGWPFDSPWYGGTVSYLGGICPHAEAAEHTSVYLETLVRPPQTEKDMDLVIRAIGKVYDARQEIASRRCRESELVAR